MSDLNYVHIFLRFYFSVFSLFLVLIEEIYQVGTTVIAFPNSSKLVKNTLLHVVFSIHLLLFRNVVKHGLLCLICYTSIVDIYSLMVQYLD